MDRRSDSSWPSTNGISRPSSSVPGSGWTRASIVAISGGDGSSGRTRIMDTAGQRSPPAYSPEHDLLQMIPWPPPMGGALAVEALNLSDVTA